MLLSPLAFVLAVELLAIKIRQCPQIKGLLLSNGHDSKIVKIAQYADDTSLFLRDRTDVKNALTIVEQFAVFSGLKLNKNKTEAMRLGKNDENVAITENIKCTLTIKILGIYFSNTTPASCLALNWESRLENLTRIIKAWEKRNLSIIGKIHIIKTFLLSQFVYIMQCLCLPEDVLKNINTIVFKFLWKKKTCNKKAFEKVRRDVMCENYEAGGLKMINIRDMQNAFLIKWLQKVYCNQDSNFSCIPMYYLEKVGCDMSVLFSNITSKHFNGLQNINLYSGKRC